MMEYYQELTLKPSAEIPLSFLWTKIFTQVHLALVEGKETAGENRCGLSFPRYSEEGLGDKLRVFAETREELEALGLAKYLTRYGDYVDLTGIRRIPSARVRGFASYSRYQPDGNRENKARRYMTRHPGISYEDALRLMKRRKENFGLPFIQIHSLSSRKAYTLLIRKEEKAEEVKGTFSTYGLSAAATVPEF